MPILFCGAVALARLKNRCRSKILKNKGKDKDQKTITIKNMDYGIPASYS